MLQDKSNILTQIKKESIKACFDEFLEDSPKSKIPIICVVLAVPNSYLLGWSFRLLGVPFFVVFLLEKNTDPAYDQQRYYYINVFCLEFYR